MADPVRLAFYPFLEGARDWVRSSGIDLGAVLTAPRHKAARERAVKRVEGALGDGFAAPRITNELDALDEVLSVPVARMLVVLLNEKVLVQKYAAAEARAIVAALARDDPQAMTDAVKSLGLTASPVEGGWRMHMADYLKAAPSGTEWKLILRPVAAGFVVVDKGDMARLCGAALERRIIEELEAERAKKPAEDLRTSLAPALAILEPKLVEARENWSVGDFGPVQPGLFPPCVKVIFEQLSKGQNLPHHARFALTTFLNTIGWGPEQIMDYLSSTPNFDREKSRYQIEHITGQKGVEAYMVPNCSTMQTNGICPLDRRDGVCARIKNPLSYYRKRLWMNKKDEEKAEKGTGKAASPVAVAAEGSPAIQPPTEVKV